MASFFELKNSERLKVSDDLAMQAASVYFQKHGITFRRWGFDASVENIWEFPPILRHKPDLSINDSGNFKLCELKGCGIANVVRVDVEKIESYKIYEQLKPLMIFIYKADTNQCTFITFTDFLRTLKGLKVIMKENWGRIFEIPCSRFKWENLN